MHPDLAELAAAHGVATHYENWEQREVDVEEDVVVAVLAQLGVHAETSESIATALADARTARESGALPPTVVLRSGSTRELAAPALVEFEDGTSREFDSVLPPDLPLGWHHLVTGGRRVVLVVVPDRLPEVPPAWGWMLQLYALRSAGSWGMGDFGDLATVAARSARSARAAATAGDAGSRSGSGHSRQSGPWVSARAQKVAKSRRPGSESSTVAAGHSSSRAARLASHTAS